MVITCAENQKLAALATPLLGRWRWLLQPGGMRGDGQRLCGDGLILLPISSISLDYEHTHSQRERLQSWISEQHEKGNEMRARSRRPMVLVRSSDQLRTVGGNSWPI